MQTVSHALLAAGLLLAACADAEEPSTDGMLFVTTSTEGGDPDQDGYVLTVDELDSLSLESTGTAELGIPSGPHTLRLLGVAEHCSVVQGSSREVDVPSQGTVTVVFEISCPGSIVLLVTTTHGVDIPTEYRVVIDDTEWGNVPPNGSVRARIAPGSRTIALTGLPSNCATDGPASRTVTVLDPDFVPIVFPVVCTATTGVIRIALNVLGLNPWEDDLHPDFRATLDDTVSFVIDSTPHYLTGMAAGDHVISLAGGPPNCPLETEPKLVSVAVGGLTRDTVGVGFTVDCQEPTATVRITAPTTGLIPSSTRYQVWYEGWGPWDYGATSIYLGDLEPNGRLVVRLSALGIGFRYYFQLRDVPASCSASAGDPPQPVELMPGATLDLVLPLACPP